MKTLHDLSSLLREVANRDKVISDEEEHLLRTIDNFIKRYQGYLKKAEADGKIDNKEKARLKEMKKEILEGAWVTSMEDGKISDDESELISTIYEYLKDISL